MYRISPRLRVVVACAAVAVTLAACGNPSIAAAPETGPDLFESLPATPTVLPSITPSPTPTAKPTVRPKPAAKPATPAGAQGAAPHGPVGGADPGSAGWRKVGGDEFNTDTVDTTQWGLYDSKGGFGTGYRKPEAISQSDGQLHITAREDVSGGMGNTLGQLYGRWEFRAKTTPGRGFGSAILLWPDSGKWPDDGEVDIMEVPSENRDLAHFVLHWGSTNQINGNAVPGNYTQWHTFAVEWLPDRITWYVDGVKQYENTDKAAIPTTPMHLTVQLDQGPQKDWILPRDDTTPAEVSLDVDYVRIYAK
ncbi:family 16 glycosylhydrolase [Pseudonocardia sp. GCM10023141]|uniref:family 16 glycosylhydrolase n=1 Tax=Pseudonocardia sp. GCM10023141 TaxID=3252653 RepID=UPI003623DE6F